MAASEDEKHCSTSLTSAQMSDAVPERCRRLRSPVLPLRRRAPWGAGAEGCRPTRQVTGHCTCSKELVISFLAFRPQLPTPMFGWRPPAMMLRLTGVFRCR